MDKDVKDSPRNIVAMDYSEVNHTYANQSSLQLSSNDVALQLGVTSIDENGNDVIKIENIIRMSDGHFENFVKNCNNVLEKIKEHNAK